MIVATSPPSDMPGRVPEHEREAMIQRIEDLAVRAGVVRESRPVTMGPTEIDVRVATLRHRVEMRRRRHADDVPDSDSAGS